MASRCRPRSYATYKGEGGQLRSGETLPLAKGTKSRSQTQPLPVPTWSKPRKATHVLSFTSGFETAVQGSAPHTGQARGDRMSTCPSAVCPGSTLKAEFFASVSSPEQIPASGSLAGDPATDVALRRLHSLTLTPVTHTVQVQTVIPNHNPVDLESKEFHVPPLDRLPPRVQVCTSGRPHVDTGHT